MSQASPQKLGRLGILANPGQLGKGSLSQPLGSLGLKR